jgi:hypothetical protein
MHLEVCLRKRNRKKRKRKIIPMINLLGLRKVNILFWLLLLLCNNQSYGQTIELRLDTVHIIGLIRLDSTSNKTIASSRFVVIGNMIADGSLIPFEALRCTSNDSNNKLYFENFNPVIDEKSILELHKRVEKKKYITIDKFRKRTGALELNKILDCIQPGDHTLIAMYDLEIVAAYFLFECEIKRSLDYPSICLGSLTTEKIPVFIKVVKYL